MISWELCSLVSRAERKQMLVKPTRTRWQGSRRETKFMTPQARPRLNSKTSLKKWSSRRQPSNRKFISRISSRVRRNPTSSKSYLKTSKSKIRWTSLKHSESPECSSAARSQWPTAPCPWISTTTSAVSTRIAAVCMASPRCIKIEILILNTDLIYNSIVHSLKEYASGYNMCPPLISCLCYEGIDCAWLISRSSLALPLIKRASGATGCSGAMWKVRFMYSSLI